MHTHQPQGKPCRAAGCCCLQRGLLEPLISLVGLLGWVWGPREQALSHEDVPSSRHHWILPKGATGDAAACAPKPNSDGRAQRTKHPVSIRGKGKEVRGIFLLLSMHFLSGNVNFHEETNHR